MEKLCRTYYYPLYGYVRRQGYSPEDTQDLTQEFFARLFAGNYVAAAQPGKGRFRWFVLCAVKRFLLKERNRMGALKRGGALTFVPFDHQQAEGRYRLEVADPSAPGRLFDRAWAIAVIEKTHELLREEYLTEGKGDLFECLKVFPLGRSPSPDHRGSRSGSIRAVPTFASNSSVNRVDRPKMRHASN